MKKKQGKKASKPFVIILLCLVLAIGSAAAYAYGEEIVEIAKFVKNNISAVVYALTNSSEDVSAKKEENDKKQQELLGQVVEVTMRDLTDEERQMLAEGKLTYEEALALIRGETIAPVTTEVIPEVTEEVSAPEQTKPHTPSQTTAATVQTTTEVTTAEETTTEVVTTEAVTTEKPMTKEELKARQEEIIAEIYLLRSLYLNEIDKLIKDGKAEYIALPKEKHTLKNKMEIAERMLKDGNALEAECDTKMNNLLSELESILKQLSLDTSIVSEIRTSYKEQKKIKKTELYNEYYPKMN